MITSDVEVSERQITLVSVSRLSDRWAAEEIKLGNVHIEKVPGGETNRNFKVTDEDGAWFVRLPYEGHSVVDRAVEAQNMIALKGCRDLSDILPDYRLYILKGVNILEPHLAPKRDLPDGTMVARWLEGQVLNAELLQKEEVQEALVGALRRFHNSGVRFVNDYDPFFNEILTYRRRLIGERPVFGDDVLGIVSEDDLLEAEEAEQIAWDGLPRKEWSEKFVSTHNDLIFGNLHLGEDGKVRLLDWEYAGFNAHGYHYDWGTLLGENLFYEPAIDIEVYEDILNRAGSVYGDDFDSTRAYYGALANVLVTFWWGLVQYQNAKTEERRDYFRQYVPKRVNGIRWLMDVLEDV